MRVLWISALVVALDQLTKAIVLRFMVRHESIPVLGDWLKLTFTENPGMAFGLQIGPEGLVTVLSVGATALVFYYLYRVRHAYMPYRASLALILGGAVGNIIDRVFYGVLLGYDSLFMGKVVDFIHVSVWEGFIPQAVPFMGGAYMELFPIWNVADMAIVVGVVGILFFQNEFHRRLQAEQMAAREADQEPKPLPGASNGHVPARAFSQDDASSEDVAPLVSEPNAGEATQSDPDERA